MNKKVRAMVKSIGGEQEVTVIDKVGDNDYIVTTSGGVTCHAIFNFFTGLYYADDVYGKVNGGENV